ncbi:MAG: tRNA (adenosine(37)-N6)-threonylcarbamoyltransferase complex transferase subunit TsaD, partial [Verrucomicrobiota bacterium]
TSVRYFLEKENFREEALKKTLPDICASVQEAIVGVLVEKTRRAAEQEQLDIIGVSGGVACNSALRAQLQALCQKKGWQLYFPPASLATDNAAMIAFAAIHHLQDGEQSLVTQEIVPQWKVGK